MKIEKIENINLIPGYNELSESNKLRLNYFIDSNELNMKLTSDSYKVSGKTTNLLILNFYEENKQHEFTFIVSELDVFSDENINVMFDIL